MKNHSLAGFVKRSRGPALVCLCSVVPPVALANPVSISYLEGRLPVAPDAITSYGPDLFGDKVNLFNGSLVFEQTDLSLPGNDALPVALVRKHTPGQSLSVRGQLGDWDLETPRIGGSFSNVYGWVTASGGVNRCSGGLLPPIVSSGNRPAGDGKTQTPLTPVTGAAKSPSSAASGPVFPGDPQRAVISFIASDYWSGTYLQVPGQVSQEVLTRAPGYGAAPADGSTYPLVTHQNWQISCLTSVQNAAGEGFLAVSPQGVRYRFDWMASRDQTLVKKSGASIGRRDMFLMATEVADRFGNWVRYTYDPANPLLLTRIESKDGRVITVTNTGGRATSAFDGTRTMRYGYTAGFLTSVVRPDGSRWTFNLAPLVPNDGEWASIGEGANCDFPGEYPAKSLTGTITHPSGATGSFTTRYGLLGRSGVQRFCKFASTRTSPTIGAVWPRYVVTSSLSEKAIAGPGMPTMRWAYSINAPGSWDSCTTCPDTRLVTVNEPNGSQTLHTFGNRWRVNEGQLLRIDEGWNGSAALRSTSFRYRGHAVPQAFVEQFGLSPLQNNDWLSSRHRPMDQKVTRVQNTSFTWEVGEPSNPVARSSCQSVAGFDCRVRPVLLRKFSTPGAARREAITYHDNPVRWILGQVASVKELDSGLVQEAHEYDNKRALLLNSSSFGKRTVSYTYNATDGTVATVSDAAGRATGLSSYRRGQPQLVNYPNATSESQVINNLGNPDSRTNAAGTTTSYAYDTMGRVETVTYPTDDPVAYYPTEQRFIQATGRAYNLDEGHWQQTITTGNARTERYFDALWRERLAVRYDVTRPGDTTSIVETRYDAAGRKVFESYPLRSLASVDTTAEGRATAYDVLNRIRSQTDSGVPGGLSTFTTYPDGAFQRVTTNPRAFVTTAAFQTFDEPSENQISQINAPEGVLVTIQRDVFGKPTRITRSGGPHSATRSYVYDLHQRLCKTVEPETGATIQDYDLAGNVAWRASGLALPGLTACDHGSVADARKVSFTYDSRRQLTFTGYGDGSPWVSRSYTPDGLPQTISTPTSTWTLAYNNRRSMKSETLTAAGVGNFSFAYGIERHGHRSSITYPDLPTLQYAPDALGRPTQISGYVSNVWYHPNGLLAGYTAANGIAHTRTLNARGLPETLRHAGVMQDLHLYDPNGNVQSITDQQRGVTSRTMGYDGLDRLTAANIILPSRASGSSGGRWNTSRFTYDALDNLRTSTVGLRVLTHAYDPATNRLTGVSGSFNASIGYDANGNVVQRDTQSFVFDIGNRMQSTLGIASHMYDGNGRRSYTATPAGRTTLRLYSQAGRLLFTDDSVNGTTRHIHLGDQVVAENNTRNGVASTRWLHTDSLGSPVATTGPTGAVLERTSYEPYGLPTADNPDGIGFTGHVNDVDTGLVYMQQRYYDPIAGRFLSVDPVTTDAKTGEGFNRYVYGNNNPYRFKDPDGRWAEDLVLGLPSLAMGSASLVGNLRQGNLGAAAVDAIGMVADTAAIALPGVPGGAGLAIAGVRKYEVGSFSALKGKSTPGDQIEIHHAAQKHPAGQAIPGYDPKTGPSIALPRGEHREIPTQKGSYTGSARDLLAKDIKDLRSNTNAPNSSLRELIQLNKETYPDAFAK